MPRRIPDFADGYASWNTIMTIGSLLTIKSLIIFPCIIPTVIMGVLVLPVIIIVLIPEVRIQKASMYKSR